MGDLGPVVDKPRRGQDFLQSRRVHPIEQEACLELPLGYDPAPVYPASVAIVLHAFHVHLLAETRSYLEQIPFAADLFVSTDTADKRQVATECFANWPGGTVTVEIMPNRGRDIAPKIVGFAAVHDRYEYVLHLHTKHSPHDQRLVGWRGYIFETLLGSPKIIQDVFAAFTRAPQLGILAPQHVDELRPWIRWGQNYEQAKALAARMGFPLPRLAPLDFPSGSMFWARTAALCPLLDLQLAFGEFPDELGQTDGTLAHAIERLYFLTCEQAGYDWLKVTARGELHDQRSVTAVSSDEELSRFLSHSPLRLSSMRDLRRSGVEPAVTSPPPKPRRVLHILWRSILGDTRTVAPGLRLAIALQGPAATAPGIRQVQSALRSLPKDVAGHVLADPTASRNNALRAGFASGADTVLLLDRPGLLHPGSAAGVVRMVAAHPEGVILEGACVPDPAPKPVDPGSFAVEWAGAPILVVTRQVFEATGGFDDGLAGLAAEQDFSRRARARGFPVLRCPRALFYPFDRLASA